MSGFYYILLEIVKLSVVIGFRLSPCNAKDMFTLVEITKLFIVIGTVLIIGNGNVAPTKQSQQLLNKQSEVTHVITK